MTVTSPIRDEVTFNGDWKTSTPQGDDLEEKLRKYNENKNRFIYYPWGVWVTAYARARLMNAILSIGPEDYLYADTDSNKFRHPERHMQFFEEDNERVRKRLEDACRFHHLSFKYVEPETVEGEKKLLGVWTDEGNSKRFKSLRAKTYIYEDQKGFHLVVSGLNKKATIPYLLEKYQSLDEVFEAFKDGFHVPAEATGKNTHTYIDFETGGQITDFRGETSFFHELSSVHLEAGSYDLSLTEEYISYILDVKHTSAT